MKSTIECPKCNQGLRVPSDRGEIQVTCPKCSLRWFWQPQNEPKKEQEGSKVGSFFSKIKNAVTGGSAELKFDVEGPFILGQSFVVKVNVKVGSEAIKNKGVYLQVHSRENLKIPWPKVLNFSDLNKLRESNAFMFSGNFELNELLYEKTYTFRADNVLAANSEHCFVAQVELPSHLIPTIKANYTNVSWELNAYIHVNTVDPKTGWHSIEVKAK